MDSGSTQSDPPETVLTNYFGAVNTGDAAIAHSTVAALRNRLGRGPSTIESWHPEADVGRFSADVLGPLWKPHSPPGSLPVSPFEFVEAARKLPYLARSLRRGPTPDTRLLRPHERDLVRRMRRADLIVSCGGGYLHDVFGPVFLRHLYTVAVATLVDTPVYLNGQSIGPFRSAALGRVAGRILSAVDYITVRDPRSAIYLADIGVTDVPIQVTADNAFLLEPRPPDRDLPETGGLCVGATVRRWAYPGQADPGTAREQYRDSMAAVFDHLVETYDASLVLFSHTNADVTEADRIRRRCAHLDRLRVLAPDVGPRELKGLAGAVDVVIGTRMHSMVFATAMGTPTLCVSYLPKARTVMGRLDLEEYCVDIADVTPAVLCATIDRLLANRRTVSDQLAAEVPALVSAAEQNSTVAAALVAGEEPHPSSRSR
ncbi:MAG: polysaccharide pyruvyl transferase family protein [Haloarculaceae archaeon]